MSKKKVYNLSGSFRVGTNAGRTAFSAAYEAATFPGFDFYSWGDTHDSLTFKSDNYCIASWDDNDGVESEYLLLYIKTSTHEIKIYRSMVKYEAFIANALVTRSVRIVYDGNSTTYTAPTNPNGPLTYNLGQNCNLTIVFSMGSVPHYDIRIGWDDIPNLEKIGGGIATVLRTVSKNNTGATGNKPSFWSGGHGSTSGYNLVKVAGDGSNLTKTELIAGASSSPGNAAFDKVVFNWNSSSDLKSLALHSPKSISKSTIKRTLAVANSTTNKVTLNNHGLNEGSPICITNSTVTYQDINGIHSLSGDFYATECSANDFKLTDSLSQPIQTLDLTNNGSFDFSLGSCVQGPCEINWITSEVQVFDLLDPPPFLPTTNVGGQGIDLSIIP